VYCYAVVFYIPILLLMMTDEIDFPLIRAVIAIQHYCVIKKAINFNIY